MPIYTPSKDIVAGSNISVSQTSTSATVAVTNVGSPNGIASLDGAGKIPVSQLPNSVMEYKGTWNASTNTPTLADGTGSAGDVYRVTTGGTQNLGSGNITFEVGDYCVYNGSVWEKSDTTDAVASINGLTGVVTLTTANVADSTDKRYVTEAEKTKLANTAGTNTGDQNLFSTIAVAGQSSVVADATSDTLTLVAGSNIAITTNATTDTITIATTGSGDVVGPASSVDNNVALFDGTTGKLLKDSGLQLSGANTGDQNLFQTVQVFNSFNTMVSPTATLPVVAETTADTLYIYGGTNISLSSDPSTDSITISTVGRATLLDVTNYYVNATTGNDTTGTGSVASPWKTIQRACNEVATLDCNAKQVTINVAAGTYNEFVNLPNCVGVATAQQMRIIGDTTTPSNVTVSGFSATNVAHNWNLNGFRVGTGSGTALGVNAGSIQWNNINFASVGASGTHMSLSGAGKIVFGGTGYTISGNAAAHINNIGLSFCNMSNATINIVGTLTMTHYIICNYLSLAWLHASTWNGTGITSLGPRYTLSSCSVVYVNSATPDTYLAKAGSVAGSAVTNAVIF